MAKKLEILNKNQQDMLAKIERLRGQIKRVAERELAKALIPIHEHKPSVTAGSGTEDVPAGKLAALAKCGKCGNAHTLGKCGELTMGKAELVDEKGVISSNSINNPPKNGATTKVQNFTGRGVVLPGYKLGKALTAGMGSGPASTAVNDLGKVKKVEPPMAKPPSGVSMSTKVPTSSGKPLNPAGGAAGGMPKMGMAKGELEKGMFAAAAKQGDAVSASAPKVKAPSIKLPTPGDHAERASNFGAAMGGEFTPKAPVSSGLELAKPKAAGLASPKAAMPKAAAVSKPGIFGKLMGR